MSSTKHHRTWGVSDEGIGVYCGSVTLYDNTRAALVEKDGTVLVLHIKEERAAEIETLKTDQVVTMGKEGSLTTGRSQGRSR
jgi:sulfur transfer protein SufE